MFNIMIIFERIIEKTLKNSLFNGQQEIDFIEEKGGTLRAFECKLKDKKQKIAPKLFLKSYPGSSYTVVNKTNFIQNLT